VTVLISGSYRASPHPLWTCSLPSQTHLLPSTHFGLPVFPFSYTEPLDCRPYTLPPVCPDLGSESILSETSSLYSVILENVLVYFNVFHFPPVNQIQNIQTTNKMHFSISDVFFFTVLSPTCFGRHSDFLQGDVITRIQTYNLVHKANLVHNLLLVYLSISTCFGRLCAHHQEKQLFMRNLY
jgi:hypothetical protein